MKGKKGKFIVFEGLDGSGKTVQARHFFKYLKSKGVKVVLTHEPTDRGPIGKLLRNILQQKEKINSLEAFQLLYCADRAEHLEKEVLTALGKGKWVVSDRYYYSTIAYGSLKLDKNWLASINTKFLKPDKTFLIDVGPRVCLQRIDKDGRQREFFEKEEKLKKARNGYLWCVKKFKEMKVVDGERGIREIARELEGEAEKLIKNKV